MQQNPKILRRILMFVFSTLFFLILLPSPANAACTEVASNQTTCSGSQTVPCSQPRPLAGNVQRWCCDDQPSCSAAQGQVQQQISSQMAGNLNDKPIPEIKFPCGLDTKNPEFASLRPYQAAVCGDANKAYYCSNSLIFTETFNDFRGCENYGQSLDQGQFICDLSQHGGVKVIPNHSVIVDVANVQLPILGNTDNTKNSQSSTDQFDDATKMNEYLSWYLNGTENRAEYGSSTYPNASDFAGPIQKVMPGVILDAQRVATLNTIVNSTPQVTEDDVSTGKTELENHNQLVVCADPDSSGLWALAQDFLGLGKFNAIDCYKGDGSGAQGGLTMHLNDWNKDKLPGNIAANAVSQAFITGLKILFPFVPQGLLQDSLGHHWELAKPPLPWYDATGKPFENSAQYQKAYLEWKGNTCVVIPLINQVICIYNVFVPTKYADFFKFIPLANTRDTHGANADFIAEIQPSGETEIKDKSYDIPKSAPLWMAHNQETYELSQFLNKSFTPKGVKNDTTTYTDTEPPFCNVVNVRTNMGDNTFAGQPHGIEVPNVRYTITKVPCHVNVQVNTYCPGYPPGETCVKKSVKCDAEINITLPTVTKTAWADEIYQETVANNASTFRKIYPKVTAGAPVSCIADIPASSGVTYTPHDAIGNGADNFKVKDPTEAVTTGNSTLLFPHIGSVYDYFLKGIQQALRPQGYGPGTPQNGTNCTTVSGEPGDCSWNMTLINKGIFNAAKKYNVPEILLRAVFEIENADEINKPSSYKCIKKYANDSANNFSTALGVGAIVDESYKAITCPNERLSNDVGMCGHYPGQLSRCNFGDAFELMAREILWKAGFLNGCKATGGISLSNRTLWYNATCNFYGSHNPDNLTRNYANDIPANERRQNGDMNYCDIICWRVGACSGTNYPNQQTGQ